MKRLLVLAPAATLALLSIATPVSAQTADVRAEMISLRQDARTNHRDFLKSQRCDAPREPTELQRIADTATQIAQHAGSLATRVSTRDHVQMLSIRDAAELDSWLVWTTPEICYQAPVS